MKGSRFPAASSAARQRRHQNHHHTRPSPFAAAIMKPAARAAVEALEGRCLLAADVLSYHGSDLASNGVNNQEALMTPGSVSASTFGKQFATAVDGQVYAEPLVKTGVTITTGSFQGVHDVVFVATQHDSLYAMDAVSGNVLWHDSFIFNAAGNPNPLNAAIPSGVTTVPNGDINSTDITPEIGITATPVIDPSTGLLYLTAKTKEIVSGQTHYVYKLHKINIQNGVDTSVTIGDTIYSGGNYTYRTTGTNTDPYVVGTGDGAITVTVNGNSQSRVYFNAMREMNRPGLTLYNGVIYTAWASHGDNGPYHGWILGYNASTMALTAAFNTTPNGGLGGIWQGGGVITIDPQGYMYVETGNGTFDSNNGVATVNGGFQGKADYSDCFLKIALDPNSSPTSQNVNGWGLKLVDYFSPFNNKALDGADRDLGSGAPIVLPDSAGSAAHPHLLVGSGKEGKLYLIDRDNMGKFNSATDNVVQTVGSAINGSLDTPAYFNGRLYYTSGYGGTGVSWSLTNGTINTTTGVQHTNDSFAFPGSSPYISANGTQNGIAWMLDKGTGQVRAYDANNLSNELWTSGSTLTGGATKFSVVTPVNGRVYVGTNNSLVAYGPPAPPTAPPNAPTGFQGNATGSSTVVLTWTDASNNEDGFTIERSSNNGATWQQIATVGVNAQTYTDSGLSQLQTYQYRIRAYNSYQGTSYSAYAGPITVKTLAGVGISPVDLYHFDEGSGTSALDSIGTNNGTLTGNPLPTWTNPGRVGSTALTFSGTGAYNQTGQSAVTLTNNLATTLGGTSTLAAWFRTTAVGSNTHSQAPAITGVDNAGSANDIDLGTLNAAGQIGVYVGDTGGIYSTRAVNDGKWHHVAITRDASTGVVNLYVDGVLNGSANLGTGTKTSQFKLIGALSDVQSDGATFTGANYFNGALDEVRIYNAVLPAEQVRALALPPSPPYNVAVTPASGTELDVTWSNPNVFQTGYRLERRVNGDSWQPLAILTADQTSYNDTGLLPNTTYEYRLRSTGNAGDSVFTSNIAQALTPVPPLTPTGAHTTLVTASEIDLAWTDNANNETGYKVLRRVGNAQFAEIGNLPADTTSFQDKTVQPGTTYDYHIQAYNIAGYSDFTGLTTTTPSTVPAPTDAPASVTATGGDGSVALQWTPVNGATWYNVYRSDAPGAEDMDAPVATKVTGTSYTDAFVANGQPYYYVITAANNGGESGPSTEVSATPAPATVATTGVGTTTTTTSSGSTTPTAQPVVTSVPPTPTPTTTTVSGPATTPAAVVSTPTSTVVTPPTTTVLTTPTPVTATPTTTTPTTTPSASQPHHAVANPARRARRLVAALKPVVATPAPVYSLTLAPSVRHKHSSVLD